MSEFGFQIRRSQPRRGFVLLAVLIIVGGSILVATGLLFIAQGRAADAAGSADAAQTRALAWSGVQAVMSRIDDQRDELLQGQPPQLDRQYEIYESGSRVGVARLLPMSADNEAFFSAEQGKVDLNTVDADGLVHTGLVDTTTAAAIIAYRDQTLGRPFQSELELLQVPGQLITAQTFYGPLEELTPRDQAQMEQGDLAERVQARLAEAKIRGLADVVTVFSVEPALQNSGVLRINLNVPWSDDLARKVQERFGEPAVNALKALFDQGAKFDSDAKIVQTLRTLNVPPEEWREILDCFTTEPGECHFGRLDLNTASQEALMSLEGMTPEQAAQIVSARQQLQDEDRTSIVWPVLAQIISPESFEKFANRLTTRCWTYRVRIAAGEVSADEPNGPLHNPVILEAVFDLSAPKARVAYLRDITVLQAAAQVALQSTMNQPDELAEELLERSISDTASEEVEEDEMAAPEKDDSPAQPQQDDEIAPAEPSGDSASPSVDAAPSPPARRKIGRWTGGG